MKRFAVTTATIAVALAVAGPAWAHEEITPASVPTGTPVFFTLSAANEKRVDVTRVTLTPPSGTELGHATRDPAGWTTASFTHTEAAWSGGTIKPGKFEEFGFDIEEAAQPATLNFKVVLGYSDGTTSQADVPVTVTAGSDQTVSTENTAIEGNGQNTAALVFSLLAMLLAVGAVVVALRSRAVNNKTAAHRVPTGQDW